MGLYAKANAYLEREQKQKAAVMLAAMKQKNNLYHANHQAVKVVSAPVPTTNHAATEEDLALQEATALQNAIAAVTALRDKEVAAAATATPATAEPVEHYDPELSAQPDADFQQTKTFLTALAQQDVAAAQQDANRTPNSASPLTEPDLNQAEAAALQAAITRVRQPRFFGRKLTTNTKPVPPRRKLHKLAMGLFLGLAIQNTAPLSIVENKVANDLNTPHSVDFNQTADIHKDAELDHYLQEFAHGLQSKVSVNERNMLAKMLYGEAGRGADPFEVLHTVLNRMASPLFHGTVTDLLTAKGQYVGYKAEHPVTADYRRMVDIAVDEWEANGGKKIDGCDHFYFVTDIPNVCNKFEISEDHQGRWVGNAHKKYAKRQHYCAVATDQAARFFAERDGQKDCDHSHSL